MAQTRLLSFRESSNATSDAELLENMYVPAKLTKKPKETNVLGEFEDLLGNSWEKAHSRLKSGLDFKEALPIDQKSGLRVGFYEMENHQQLGCLLNTQVSEQLLLNTDKVYIDLKEFSSCATLSWAIYNRHGRVTKLLVYKRESR